MWQMWARVANVWACANKVCMRTGCARVWQVCACGHIVRVCGIGECVCAWVRSECVYAEMVCVWAWP